MATITARRRRDGTAAYRASIRVHRDGRKVHQETRTFDTRRQAVAWARRREGELQDPATLAQAAHHGLTIGEAIGRYIDALGLEQFGRSKGQHLRQLQGMGVAELDAIGLRVEDLVSHLRRRALATSPQTANNDLVWIQTVFRRLRLLGVPVNLQAVEDAGALARAERIIAKSRRRYRRLDPGEERKLLDYFGRRRSSYPMVEIVQFALATTRRQAEITGLRQADQRDGWGVVRGLKDPRNPGRAARFKYTEEGWALAEARPAGELLFPFKPHTVGAYFTDATRLLGIPDLRFHDLRHEAVSRLFERGMSIPEVAQHSLHESWDSLRRYTHLK